jgi:hypothetical protein
MMATLTRPVGSRRTQSRWKRGSIVVIAAWFAGCGPVRPSVETPARETEPPAESTIAGVTQVALDAAARRTKIDRSQLEVVTAESVVWPSGAFGCPQDDTMYTQAAVRGYRIRIRAGEHLLDYHSGVGGEPFLCPPGRAVDPLPERLLTTPANPDQDRVPE